MKLSDAEAVLNLLMAFATPGQPYQIFERQCKATAEFLKAVVESDNSAKLRYAPDVAIVHVRKAELDALRYLRALVCLRYQTAAPGSDTRDIDNKIRLLLVQPECPNGGAP